MDLKDKIIEGDCVEVLSSIPSNTFDMVITSPPYDNIRDFIVFHYITPRKDSEFWKEASDTKRWSTRLKRLMSMWSYKMPRENDYINDIGNNFYQIRNIKRIFRIIFYYNHLHSLGILTQMSAT